LSRDKKLAGEWAVLHSRSDGYINEYELDYDKLAVLHLDTMPIENWIAVLMANRKGTFNEVTQTRMQKFISLFGINISNYDIIEGWRADDAFFSFVEDFLNVGLSLEKMQEAMKFGDLGIQICIKSEIAFNTTYLKYKAHYPAEASFYYDLAINRDRAARKEYWELKNKTRGTLIFDLVGRD